MELLPVCVCERISGYESCTNTDQSGSERDGKESTDSVDSERLEVGKSRCAPYYDGDE